jgi:hypothetical protein
MSRSLYDQKTQIHKSTTYDDTVAPSEANWETNPTNLEADLNSLRSAISLHLDDQSGNWYDDLNTPSTFESGAQRGINNLNTDLHELERKRLLRRHAMVGVDIVVPSAVAATASFASTGVFSNGEQVVVGSTTYTLTSPFVDAANNIDASGTTAQTHENLRRAINDDGIAGTNYGTGTVANADVTATDTATTTDITAKVAGTAGNLITTTTTCANASWGAGMTGGVGDLVILGAGELPNNTTAAIGTVTTRGTVCAYNSTFGTATLDEVAGASTIQPDNLVKIVDGVTRDPIVDSSGREIMALMQSESNTDGSTIAATTPNRVQFTFVTINADGDDLVIADGSEIGGRTIDYAYVERNAFDDLPEHAFLGEDFTDVGAGSATRQSAYDNQGATAVNLVTNAILDIEGAGLYWKIRDDLEADLFTITEGSAGDTTEIALGSQVDTFNNDAVTNDFANELKIDTSGTEIDIGVTAGHIETTGTDNLHIQGGGEIYLDDGNQTGSTWTDTDGIKLSDTTAEWDAFKTQFGEVSLLNAIVEAADVIARNKTVATVTANIAADTNVTGAGGTPNLSAQLGDYSAVTFLTDVDVYVNGQLQWNGADAAANNDVYPGDSAANGDLKFEYDLNYRGGSNPDVVTMIIWGE